MGGRYGNLDYPTLTKRGFALGVGLFVVGALGELALNGVGVAVPGWTETLLFEAEVLGILLAPLAVLVFGVALPLTE